MLYRPAVFRASRRCILVLSAVVLAAGCQRTVKDLAKGSDALATDARAVLAALEGSNVPADEVLVWKYEGPPSSACPIPSPCAGVVVTKGRITFVEGRYLSLLRLRPLAKLSRLEKLQLRHGTFTKLDHLPSLRGLRQLRIRRSKLQQLDLSGLKQLSLVALADNALSSLRGLAGLERLVQLDVSGNRLKEIDGLAGLSRLSHLDVSNNRLTSLSGIVGLQHLAIIKASKNQVTHVGPLHSLPALKELDLAENKIARFDAGVRALYALERLHLDKNPLLAIANLRDLPDLKKLTFDARQLVSVHDLEDIGLAELALDKSKVVTVRRIGGKNSKLERIELPSTVKTLEITDLPLLKALWAGGPALETVALARLPKLEKLDLTHCPKLTQDKLELVDLPKLTWLNLRNSGLTAIPRIRGVPKPKLVSLNLEENAITSLRGLHGLDAYRLDISKNRLTSLSLMGLASLSTSSPERMPATKRSTQTRPSPLRLGVMIATHNQIASLAGIEAYPSLTVLNLDHNKLTTLRGLEGRRLETLRVSHNQLTTLAPLTKGYVETLIATYNKLADTELIFGPKHDTRPRWLGRYDLQNNLLAAKSSLLTYMPAYSSSSSGGSSGSSSSGSSASGSSTTGSIRYSGNRYSSSGGYRSGK